MSAILVHLLCRPIEVEVVRTVKQGHLRWNFVYQVGEKPNPAPKITLRDVVKTAVEESEKKEADKAQQEEHISCKDGGFGSNPNVGSIIF